MHHPNLHVLLNAMSQLWLLWLVVHLSSFWSAPIDNAPWGSKKAARLDWNGVQDMKQEVLINNRLLCFYFNLCYNEQGHKLAVLMPLGVMNKRGTAFSEDGIFICNCMKIVIHFKCPQQFFGCSFDSNDMRVKTIAEWIQCLFTQTWCATEMYFICM